MLDWLCLWLPAVSLVLAMLLLSQKRLGSSDVLPMVCAVSFIRTVPFQPVGCVYPWSPSAWRRQPLQISTHATSFPSCDVSYCPPDHTHSWQWVRKRLLASQWASVAVDLCHLQTKATEKFHGQKDGNPGPPTKDSSDHQPPTLQGLACSLITYKNTQHYFPRVLCDIMGAG